MKRISFVGYTPMTSVAEQHKCVGKKTDLTKNETFLLGATITWPPLRYYLNIKIRAKTAIRYYIFIPSGKPLAPAYFVHSNFLFTFER